MGYDPSRTRTTGLALRAFRLTDTFMALYKEGKFTFDSLAGAHMSNTDVFQELTLTVRNSHLSSALLLELQDECGINANAADFSRLELHTNPFLENQMQHFERNLQRQKSAQQQYLLKKKQEAQIRLMRGEEALPEEELGSNPLFKPIPQPSRLESLLIANQMYAYCQQVNQFTGQSFAKLFLMQSLNSGKGQ